MSKSTTSGRAVPASAARPAITCRTPRTPRTLCRSSSASRSPLPCPGPAVRGHASCSARTVGGVVVGVGSELVGVDWSTLIGRGWLVKVVGRNGLLVVPD